MSLPLSFAKMNFTTGEKLRPRRRIMIGQDGPAGSGKSEFALSAPGPGMALCLDRGIDSVLDNDEPPATRQPDWGFHLVQVPKATQGSQALYLEYWKKFYNIYLDVLNNPDCRSVFVDGDSDSWELQRLAEFGRLTKIPSILYDNVNAARKAMYSRAHDSGKIVLASNKVRKKYVTKFKDDGTPEISEQGKEVRIWSGEYERQGFGDMEYLWNIQIRHHYDESKGVFGIKILMCKNKRSLEGYEMWGDECNFQSLVQAAYPNVTLAEWGY